MEGVDGGVGLVSGLESDGVKRRLFGCVSDFESERGGKVVGGKEEKRRLDGLPDESDSLSWDATPPVLEDLGADNNARGKQSL